MKQKSGWHRLSSKPYDQTVQGRDVYEDQQFERNDLPQKQGMGFRAFLAGLAAVAVGALFYTFWALVAGFSAKLAVNTVPQATVQTEADMQDAEIQETGPPMEGETEEISSGTDSSGSGEYQYKSEFFRKYGGDDSMAAEPADDVTAVADPGQDGGQAAVQDGQESSGSAVGLSGYEFKSKLFGGSGGFDVGTSDGNQAQGNSGTDSGAGTQTNVDGNGVPQDAGTGVQGSDAAGMDGASSGGTDITVVRKESEFRWAPYSIDQVFFTLLVSFGTFALLYEVLKRNLKAQNMLADTSDINQYKNDQHLMLPEEMQRKFDYFPDSGAHAPVEVNCLISHMMVTNKGVDPIEIYSRYKSDVIDPETGEVIAYAGEVMTDAEGQPIVEVKPFFDREFSKKLFDSVGVCSSYRKYYNPARIPYNPEKKRGKAKYDTVADFINNEWTFPEYEVQRPGGVYLVDTAPVNCLV